MDAAELVDKYKLDHVDAALMQLLLDYPGLTEEDLAKELKYSKGAIHARVSKPSFQKAITEFRMPAHDLIKAKLTHLAKKYLKLCDSKNENVAERAISKILMTYGVLRNNVTVEGSTDNNIAILEMPSIGKTVTVKRIEKEIENGTVKNTV